MFDPEFLSEAARFLVNRNSSDVGRAIRIRSGLARESRLPEVVVHDIGPRWIRR